MAAPTNAATPPVMWAMPLPAKSMKPYRAYRAQEKSWKRLSDNIS
jgi:hypothetical protein